MHQGDERAGNLAWGRALVLACVALLTGAVAHVSAGGLLPGWPTLLVLLAAMVVACRPCLDRPASTRRVVALTVSGQTLLHGALSLTAGHAHGDSGGDSGGGAGGGAVVVPPPGPSLGTRVDPGTATGGGAGDVYGWPDLLADLGSPAAAMAALHLLASVAVGLWLAHGERVLWTLLCTVWRRIAPPLPTTGPAIVTRGPVHVPQAPASTPLHDLASIVTRRGPPALLAT